MYEQSHGLGSKALDTSGIILCLFPILLKLIIEWYFKIKSTQSPDKT